MDILKSTNLKCLLVKHIFQIKFVFQTGQLNEYTERKKLSSDVCCMALGSVAAGEQRAWFLAVGLNDNTVRIISLDPAVSISGDHNNHIQ